MTVSPIDSYRRRTVTAKTTASLLSSDFATDHELVHHLFDDLKLDKMKRNHWGMARSLVGLVDILRDMTLRKEEYENYDVSQLEKTKSKAFKQICQTVQEITADTQDFFQFAYELRKIDANNKYSRPILGQNIKSDALVQLICTNSWNTKNLKMTANEKNKYKIKMPSANKYL